MSASSQNKEQHGWLKIKAKNKWEKRSLLAMGAILLIGVIADIFVKFTDFSLFSIKNYGSI